MSKPLSENDCADIERRLGKAMKQAACTFEHQEPLSLRPFCEAIPRVETQTAHSRRPLYWTAAAAAVVMAIMLPHFFQQTKEQTLLDYLNRPCSVSPDIDKEALYAARPVLPPLPQPVPSPIRNLR